MQNTIKEPINIDVIKYIYENIDAILIQYKDNPKKLRSELVKLTCRLLINQKDVTTNNVNNSFNTQFKPRFKELIENIKYIIKTSQISVENGK